MSLRDKLMALADECWYICGYAQTKRQRAASHKLALAAARMALDEAAQTCHCHGMAPNTSPADRRLCAATLIRALRAALDGNSK